MVVILGYTVKSLVNEHGADHRAEGIQDAACREAEERHTPCAVMEYEAQSYESETCKHRIYHHSLQVELQRLFRFGADTYHTDADKFGNLAPGHGVEHLEASEQVEYELRHAVVSRDRQVHHNLDNQEYVDTAAEVVIHLLLFLCFFKSHSLGTYMVELLFL